MKHNDLLAKNVHVVNKHTHKPEDCDVYIGRPSPLGNPFNLRPDIDDPKVRRDEACDRFENGIGAHLNSTDGAAARDYLNHIRSVYLQHGKVNLVCYCAPRRCHGDTIKKLLLGLDVHFD